MKQLTNLKFSALAVLTGLVLIAAPAYAEHGSNEAEQQQSTTVSSSTTTETEQPGGSGRLVAHTEVAQTETEATNDDNGGVNPHKAQSQAARQKKCQSLKQGLETKFNRIVTNSQRAQDRISGILDKTIKYQQDNNLTIDSSLVTAAQAAQTKSADSITALKQVQPSLDCNNASVASDVANFKTAAQTTRDNLKAFRRAVKAVLQALEAAKPSTQSQTGGSNQ